ncbi:FHA domain-containing protein [Haliangium sp. UPWRP_2]|uniref:FHA domain-containing protein n=1 Tax=Haliangium sp. UPWRP_2 TaxID=1931276 RepID=UPI000B5444E2|nr:FHA domain-containing protein [Haliangium sp. UPWRP_2]PSM32207.1 FHA domain-containing protein [Haliangium sp. UPWRP_2]HNN90791.1 FHA domain-containing protein [Pseudomonadota bacterium]
MSPPLVELYIESGMLAGRVRAIEPGQAELILGRNDPSGQLPPVDISFEDVDASHSLLVSRRHLSLRISGQGVSVVDLGSVNGTTLDGRLLPPHTEVPVPVGARLQLAPPEGPTLILRERLSQTGWGSVGEEVQRWQESYEALQRDYKQLQEAHALLVGKLRGQESSLPREGVVDWSRCQGKLLDSLERLTFVYQQLVDATIEPSVRGYVQRVINNLNDLRGLLSLDQAKG